MSPSFSLPCSLVSPLFSPCVNLVWNCVSAFSSCSTASFSFSSSCCSSSSCSSSPRHLFSVPITAGQTAITLVQPVVSITRQARKIAKIPCEFSQKSITYIHWYHQQPGKALQRLLYYHLATSKQTMNAGFSSNKFYAYKSKDQSCTLEVQNLGTSDAGIYYCASWDSTVTRVPLLSVQKYHCLQLPGERPALHIPGSEPLPLCFSLLGKLGGGPGQSALTMDQPVVSITRQAGKTAKILCQLSQKSITYIHWYRQQPGKAPQRLLYYDMAASKQTLDAGFTSDKFYAYKSKDQSCTLTIEKLGTNDAGTYYCASWDSTVTQLPQFPVQKSHSLWSSGVRPAPDSSRREPQPLLGKL
uniref:Ig-like domain-containing protein n=1 Tax=Ornithorhynchus anatinus TaxID=9258 RepID=A0A6I8NH75_ORNAN